MPKFLYKAKTNSSQTVEGEIEAESPSEVLRKLGGQGYFPVSIREQVSVSISSFASRMGNRVPLSQLSIAFRQLSDLLNAGLPLASVLKMTAEQTTHPALKRIFEAMTSEVREGKSLSEAMRGYPSVFTVLQASLVHAGETGGMLDKTLERLADFTERQEEVRSQISSAMAYPAFIVVVGCLTVLFLLTVIVPKMSILFTEFKQSLPLPTRVMLGISYFLHDYFWALPALAVLVFWGMNRPASKAGLRKRLDRILFKIPVIKSWAVKNEIGQWARTLSSLLQNGVPVIQAVRVSFQTVQNAFFREQIRSIEGQVQKGVSLSRSMRDVSCIPAYACNLVAVGEEGGRVDQSLMRIADSYTRDAQRELKVVVTLLEPTLILVVGAILGGIVISVMLPIFEINTMFH